ncbi:MAG: crosslink repair DNA glycosylase YcaQ family protein [Steroidobacteraceae bacterium]
MPPTLQHLRRYAIARSLFKPTTLRRAIEKLGFVQADPIRAPARAQDLTLRHRVVGYRAGDLERRYPRLALEEDYFVNYGYLLREHHRLMHPRTPPKVWSRERAARAQELLTFIREQGTAHPRAVDRRFAHGKILNWFGGSTNATTRLLDEMHYRGLLRVARRDSGTRVYAPRSPDPEPETFDEGAVSARIDTLVDLIVRKYAPLPGRSLTQLLRFLSGGVPQWSKHRSASLERAKKRLASARMDGIDWYWPDAEVPSSRRWRVEREVRLLTPFDPVVWDRQRFEVFWGWQYRFEAYTPAAKRKLGYYALPLLWGERVIGWGNLTFAAGSLESSFGYLTGRAPREAAYRKALEAELERMRIFMEPRGVELRGL